MSDFNQAFKLVLANEGGYDNDADDPGGETYKGIARKIHSKWDGWTTIDIMKRQPGFPGNLDKNDELQSDVANFYRVTFWDPMNGDKIIVQQVANSIFDFGVNAGLATSVALAQMVIGATADGILGPQTLSKLNEFKSEFFIASFTVAKIARYINIVKKRPTSRKYFYGWVCRALGAN
jgi:lysozyme family protein